VVGPKPKPAEAKQLKTKAKEPVKKERKEVVKRVKPKEESAPPAPPPKQTQPPEVLSFKYLSRKA
jgi:hypothetical protein